MLKGVDTCWGQALAAANAGSCPLWLRSAVPRPQRTHARNVSTPEHSAQGFGNGFWPQCLDLSGFPKEGLGALAAGSETQHEPLSAGWS